MSHARAPTGRAALPSPSRQGAAFGVFAAITFGAAGLGSLATIPNIATWYDRLAKPDFVPPNWVFPIVWTILYVLMAVAAWLVWRARYEDALPARKAARSSNAALVPFFVQLVLNVAWSVAFFGMHSPLIGSGVIVLLFGAIFWTIVSFWPIARNAALLLVPYLAWVAFATALNAGIYALNEPVLYGPGAGYTSEPRDDLP